jgi:hypothetical protein
MARARARSWRRNPNPAHRMEAVYFTVIGIVLYLVADRVVVQIERRAGRVLEHRTLLFFVLLLSLALVTFAAIRQFLPAPVPN